MTLLIDKEIQIQRRKCLLLTVIITLMLISCTTVSTPRDSEVSTPTAIGFLDLLTRDSHLTGELFGTGLRECKNPVTGEIWLYSCKQSSVMKRKSYPVYSYIYKKNKDSKAALYLAFYSQWNVDVNYSRVDFLNESNGIKFGWSSNEVKKLSLKSSLNSGLRWMGYPNLFTYKYEKDVEIPGNQLFMYENWMLFKVDNVKTFDKLKELFSKSPVHFTCKGSYSNYGTLGFCDTLAISQVLKYYGDKIGF